MPPSRKSVADQSYKLKMELAPLFAYAVPERSRTHLAKKPPKGPVLSGEVEHHIKNQMTSANADPIVFVSQSSTIEILDSLKMRIPQKKLPRFNEEINAALLEYRLRVEVERVPLSSWLPRYQEIVVLLRKLRPLLPEADEDELFFNIMRHLVKATRHHTDHTRA